MCSQQWYSAKVTSCCLYGASNWSNSQHELVVHMIRQAFGFCDLTFLHVFTLQHTPHGMYGECVDALTLGSTSESVRWRSRATARRRAASLISSHKRSERKGATLYEYFKMCWRKIPEVSSYHWSQKFVRAEVFNHGRGWRRFVTYTWWNSCSFHCGKEFPFRSINKARME